MKVFPMLLAATAVAFVSCERHDWEDTKKLHEQHHGAGHAAEGHGHADHAEHKGEAHGDHAGEHKAAH